MSTALKAFFAQTTVSQENIGDEYNEMYDAENPVSDADLVDEQIDIDEASIEYDEAEELIEDMDDVVVGLEGLVEAMEASLEHGGLSNHAAVFAHREAGLHLGRLGMESAQVMVSVESFGGAHERIEATQISVEGLKETIQKLKKSSSEAFSRMATAQKNFWTNNVAGLKKLQERIATVNAVIDDASGKEAEGEITIIGGKALSHNGEVSVSGIINGLNAAQKISAMLYGEYIDTADKYYKQAVGVANKNSEEEAVKTTKAYTEKLYALVEKNSAEIIGGYRLVSTKETGTDMAKNENTYESVPNWVRTDKVTGEGRDVEVPSIADLKKIVVAVDGIVKSALAKGDALVKLADTRVKYVEGIKENVSEGEDANVKAVEKVTKSVAKDLTKPIKEFSTIVYPACRTALQFVESAAKKYKAPAEKNTDATE